MPGSKISKFSFSQVCLAGVLLLSGSTSNITEEAVPEPLAGYTLEHTTTNAPPDPGSVPSTVTETAWTWEGTPGTTIHAIHPTPTGALIHLNNGLIGLDTTTGEASWSYLLPQANDLDEDETGLALTPDATMAAFTPGETTVLLDTATGNEHQRLDHGTEAGNELFAPDRLGVPHTQGNLIATGGRDPHITLTPWGHQDQEQSTGWETSVPGCEDGNNAIIDQGLLTDDTAVIVHSCPSQGPTLTGLDIDTGQQTWRLQQGDDYEPDEDNIIPGFAHGHDTEFTLVDDLLVLENISLQRGTVVIDATTGQPITDDLKDAPGEENLLRVLSDGYLTLNTPVDPDPDAEELKQIYELRDFDGTVRHSVEPTRGSVGMSIGNLLPLEDSLIKPNTSENGNEHEMVVMNWDSGEETRIPLTVDASTRGILNLAKADRAIGPLTFREVPGAVLLREHPQDDTPRLTALR